MKLKILFGSLLISVLCFMFLIKLVPIISWINLLQLSLLVGTIDFTATYQTVVLNEKLEALEKKLKLQ